LHADAIIRLFRHYAADAIDADVWLFAISDTPLISALPFSLLPLRFSADYFAASFAADAA